MLTKIVYVVVSKNEDFYLEQAWLSIYSLKMYNPSAHVLMIMDTDTKRKIDEGSDIIKFVDEIKVIELVGNYTNMQKSRILKTQVRNLIDGDFLFVDSDTIVCGDISKIDSLDHTIYAVRDSHAELYDTRYFKGNQNAAKLLNHDIGLEKTYFNSGVIYCKDNKEGRKFYSDWYKNYIEKSIVKGINMDQPSFQLTNTENKNLVNLLPDIYNCQVRHGMQFFQNALILHYLTTAVSHTGKYLLPFMNLQLYQDIKKENAIPEYIKAYIKNPKKYLSAVDIFPMDEFFSSTLFQCTYEYFHSKKRLENLFVKFLALQVKVYRRLYKLVKDMIH